MASPKKSNSKPEVYPVDRIKNPGLMTVLVILGIYILFMGSQIWAYHQAGQNFDLILHRYLSRLIFYTLIFLFISFLHSKVNDRLPTSFEVDADGITQVDRYGHRLNIAWDEMEKITPGRGIRKLAIECPAVKKRIFIPGHMAWYGDLSARIMAEFEKRHVTVKPVLQNYALKPSALMAYWFVGGLMALFALAGPVGFAGGLISDSHFTQGRGGLFLLIMGGIVPPVVFGSLAFHIFRQALRFPGKSLELTDEGIAQIDRSGNRVFIGWEEIGGFKPAQWVSVSQFEIRDDSGQKRIPLFNGYERFEDLKERVFSEFLDHYKVPPFPAAVGKTRFTRQLVGLSIWFVFLCFIVYAAIFKVDTSIPGNQTAGFMVVVLFTVGLGFLARLALRVVNQVTLDSTGITLGRLAGNQFIPWGNFERAEWKPPLDTRTDIPYYFLQLVEKNGKINKLTGDIDLNLKIFGFLKKGPPGR